MPFMPMFILAGIVLFRSRYGVCNRTETTREMGVIVIKVVGTKQKLAPTK